MKSNKKHIILIGWFLLVVVAMSGYLGPDDPDVGIKVSWKGWQGWIPWLKNDIGIKDKRTIELVVKNEEEYQYLDGVELVISQNIPNFRVTPQTATVMLLGPKGTSGTEPAVFVLETINSAPCGKCYITILANYGGRTIESKNVDVDIK